MLKGYMVRERLGTPDPEQESMQHSGLSNDFSIVLFLKYMNLSMKIDGVYDADLRLVVSN